MKNVNNNTLLKHVFANTKLVMAILSLIIGFWALRMYFYMNDENRHDPNQHSSQKISALTQTFVNAIGAYKQPEVLIDINDEAYQAGFEKLKACGQYTNWTLKEKKYESYNHLVRKVAQVNQSLAGLSQSGRLSYQYQLSFDAVLTAACDSDYGLKQVVKALGYLDSESELERLDWVEKRKRNFKPDEENSVVSMPIYWNVTKNPWRGLDGCIYMANTEQTQQDNKEAPVSLISLNPSTSDQNQTKMCQLPAMYGQAHVVHKIEKKTAQQQVVPIKDYQPNMEKHFFNLAYLLESLNSVDRDSAPVSVELNGIDIPVGWNAQLTVNPKTQTLAQEIASCVTGQFSGKEQDQVCGKYMSKQMKEQMPIMEAGALARQVGISIIDVPTGKIEAVAGDTSKCFRENYGAESKSDKCKTIPETWNFFAANDVYANPAIYADYLPGSTVKPIQALAMVRAFPDGVKKDNIEELKNIMAMSDTEAVLDILTCMPQIDRVDPEKKIYKSFSNTISAQHKNQCKGLFEMQQAATDLGWNQQCTSQRCGYQDILRGQLLGKTALEKPIFYGRVLADVKQNDVQLLQGLDNIAVDDYIQRQRNNGQLWQDYGSSKRKKINETEPSRKVSFPVLDEAVNEAFGQGSSRATSLGVATVMRNLLAAANGNTLQPVHILEHLWVANKKDLEIEMREDKAELVENKSFFKKLFAGKKQESEQRKLGANSELAKNLKKEDAKLVSDLFTEGHYGEGTAKGACADIFGSPCQETIDGYRIFSKTGTPSFDQYSNITTLARDCKKDSESNKSECYLRPVRWFVLGIGEEKGQWSKVMVVMVERNWNTAGNIDANNIATQLAFSLMKVMKEQQLLSPLQVKEQNNDNPLK